MEKKNQIATKQTLSDRLKLYCPELKNDLALVKTWAGKKITDYSESEFKTMLNSVLAEIVFITGGKMYDEKLKKPFYDLQIKTISRFLLTSFSFFSFEEIKQAFYLNSAGKFSQVFTHYGREINIEFIGSVLADYKNYKQAYYNNHGPEIMLVLNPPKEIPAPVLTEEDYLNDRRKSIEEAYQRLIVDLDMNDELFPEYFYNTLVHDKLIPDRAYESRMREAKQKIAKQNQINIMKKKSEEAKNGGTIDGGLRTERFHDTNSLEAELKKLRNLFKFDQLERHHPIVTVSKQLIVKEFFLDRMARDFKNIYVKDGN